MLPDYLWRQIAASGKPSEIHHSNQDQNITLHNIPLK